MTMTVNLVYRVNDVGKGHTYVSIASFTVPSAFATLHMFVC